MRKGLTGWPKFVTSILFFFKEEGHGVFFFPLFENEMLEGDKTFPFSPSECAHGRPGLRVWVGMRVGGENSSKTRSDEGEVTGTNPSAVAFEDPLAESFASP
jgi:hypothetical protein